MGRGMGLRLFVPILWGWGERDKVRWKLLICLVRIKICRFRGCFAFPQVTEKSNLPLTLKNYRKGAYLFHPLIRNAAGRRNPLTMPKALQPPHQVTDPIPTQSEFHLDKGVVTLGDRGVRGWDGGDRGV